MDTWGIHACVHTYMHTYVHTSRQTDGRTYTCGHSLSLHLCNHIWCAIYGITTRPIMGLCRNMLHKKYCEVSYIWDNMVDMRFCKCEESPGQPRFILTYRCPAIDLEVGMPDILPSET